jgi:hypothetical protein
MEAYLACRIDCGALRLKSSTKGSHGQFGIEVELYVHSTYTVVGERVKVARDASSRQALLGTVQRNYGVVTECGGR